MNGKTEQSRALPSLRQLEYLSALEEHGHFGRAAAACGVSTSTLSGGLAELERLLGVTLAERDRRHVLITSSGRRLAQRARRLLDEVQAWMDLAGREAAPMSGQIRLGSIPTIAPFLLPRLLPALRVPFPQLDLVLREDKTTELLAQLADGRLDLLLIAFPYQTPGCETMMLFNDGYLFACESGHRLARAQSVPSSEIARQPLMLLEPAHCLHSHALPVLEAAARAPDATFAATSLQTLVAMVAVGMGTTLLPQLAVAGGLLQGSPVVTRPLGYHSGKRSIGLCWRQSSARAEDFRALGRQIQAWALHHGVGEALAPMAPDPMAAGPASPSA